MKCLILAGGYAKRLFPITANFPKPLLLVKGKPILGHILDNVKQIDCIDEIYVAVNNDYKFYFQTFLGSMVDPALKVNLIVDPLPSKGKEKVGVIGAIDNFIIDKKIDDDLLILLGDNLFDFSLNDFVDFYNKKNECVLAVYDLLNLEHAKTMGVISMDKDLIVNFEEKPENPSSSLIAIGCYIVPKSELSLFNIFCKEENYTDMIGCFFSWLIKRENVYGYTFDGKWYDIGSIEAFNKANLDF